MREILTTNDQGRLILEERNLMNSSITIFEWPALLLYLYLATIF